MKSANLKRKPKIALIPASFRTTCLASQNLKIIARKCYLQRGNNGKFLFSGGRKCRSQENAPRGWG